MKWPHCERPHLTSAMKINNEETNSVPPTARAASKVPSIAPASITVKPLTTLDPSAGYVIIIGTCVVAPKIAAHMDEQLQIAESFTPIQYELATPWPQQVHNLLYSGQ